MPAKSKKQAKFMRAVAHGWKPKNGEVPSEAVARKFMHVEQTDQKFGGREDRERSLGMRGTQRADLTRGFKMAVDRPSGSIAQKQGYRAMSAVPAGARVAAAQRERNLRALRPKPRLAPRRSYGNIPPAQRLAASQEHNGKKLYENESLIGKVSQTISEQRPLTPDRVYPTVGSPSPSRPQARTNPPGRFSRFLSAVRGKGREFLDRERKGWRNMGSNFRKGFRADVMEKPGAAFGLFKGVDTPKRMVHYRWGAKSPILTPKPGKSPRASTPTNLQRRPEGPLSWNPGGAPKELPASQVPATTPRPPARDLTKPESLLDKIARERKAAEARKKVEPGQQFNPYYKGNK